MDEYFYVITFESTIGVTKQIRIADANPDLETDFLEGPVEDMIRANIFDRTKIGTLARVKSFTLEKIKHTDFDLIINE